LRAVLSIQNKVCHEGRIAQSETVNNVATMMGVEIQWDDVRSWASTIMISRLQKEMEAPVKDRFKYPNLTFLDRPVSGQEQGSSSAGPMPVQEDFEAQEEQPEAEAEAEAAAEDDVPF